MPPVFGPVSPSPTRFVSWAASSSTQFPLPSVTANMLTSGPSRISSTTTVEPASPNSRPSSDARIAVSALGTVARDRDALARGEPVGLHDRRAAELVDERDRVLHTVERAAPRGGDVAACHDLLRERLRPLDPGGGSVRAEDGVAMLAELVGEAGDERVLGADDREPDVALPDDAEDALLIVGADLGHALGHLGDPGVARGREHARHGGILRQTPAERVFAPPSPHDEDVHPCTAIVCSRAGPTPIIDTGTPPSSSRNST